MMNCLDQGKQSIFVLASERIYLFDQREQTVKRIYDVKSFKAIVKSTVSTELVMIYPSSKDLRI